MKCEVCGKDVNSVDEDKIFLYGKVLCIRCWKESGEK